MLWFLVTSKDARTPTTFQDEEMKKDLKKRYVPCKKADVTASLVARHYSMSSQCTAHRLPHRLCNLMLLKASNAVGGAVNMPVQADIPSHSTP